MSQPQTFIFPAFKEAPTAHHLCLQLCGMADTIDANDIIYLQSEVNYTRIFLRDGKSYLASKTLKHFNGILATPEFVRIHKSFLVNRTQVLCTTSDYVQLQNGATLPISRRQRRMLRKNRTLVKTWPVSNSIKQA
ncbi:MAG: LytTR family DNA-binding domain-containing protein [Spirosomataceae bacterium]